MCDTTAPVVTSISLRNPDLSPISKEDSQAHNHHQQLVTKSKNTDVASSKQNQVGTVMLFGVPIVSLVMDGKERLCLAQISSTLLKDFSYNEIHNRRVALGITCVQCTPVQLEILRRAGAMPVTSRRCGMITRREAERLCQSFLGDHAPPQLPENFAFEVYHECGWGCRGSFVPSRYNSSRAKCIRCTFCQLFFSPNKFIFHSHRLPESRYVQPDAANFNSWRRHLKLCGDPPEDDISSNSVSMDTAQIVHAWEDVRAMFNGGTRKRMLAAQTLPAQRQETQASQHRQKSVKNSNSGNQGQPHLDRDQSPSTLVTKPSVANPANFTPPESVVSGNPNPFMATSSTPLPSNIWNPGVNRLGPSPIPHLPFHPFSLPWLRRPLFPYPFGPACHLLADAEKLATLSAPRPPSHSAFKPVSRGTENLFSWLNPATNSSPGNILTTLPEDLSVHSAVGAIAAPATGIGSSGSSKNSRAASPVSTTLDDDMSTHQKRGRHQIQMVDNVAEDEENVDIESTEVEEECSSTSFIWVTSSSNHNNNNNNNSKRSGSESSLSAEDEKPVEKRKRVWDFDSSPTSRRSLDSHQLREDSYNKFIKQ